jgi:hypothetical protein
MDPLPNCFSICANASSIALLRSSAIMAAPVYEFPGANPP